MAKTTPQSRKMRRELDKDLAAAAEEHGYNLEWSPQEREIIDMICRQIDRKVELDAAYQATDDVMLKVKLSSEVRLIEGSIARLLKMVKTDVTSSAMESRRTVKARQAARSRWDAAGA